MGCRGRFFSSLLRSLLRPAEQTPLRPFRWFSSSWSSPSALGDGFLSFFEVGDEKSPAYRSHLQCRRPPTMRSWDLLPNSCSFIGRVTVPVRQNDSRFGSVGAYTLLEVKKAPSASDRRDFSPFRILVQMWNELAKVSLKHLKANDFIYVSGHLSSYEKVYENGQKEIMHVVIVKDLNYVQHPGKIQASENPYAADNDASAYSSGRAIPEEEQIDCLHLWQVFFANPHEWWDNRHQKPYKSCPDFKHKHTGECLFLGPGDPPWVKKQLEQYDLERAGIRQKDRVGARSCLSEFL
ncbi:hypothetical protein Taro_010614 [Colocasia esculenta]|uniref:Protein OSB1, mitochondrial n=1 Tax=Colocasia esculenta TaxID=4460 RepID=A0A843U427_COLES|nr:hypothetical protein [Colocasia esculenta]